MCACMQIGINKCRHVDRMCLYMLIWYVHVPSCGGQKLASGAIPHEIATILLLLFVCFKTGSFVGMSLPSKGPLGLCPPSQLWGYKPKPSTVTSFSLWLLEPNSGPHACSASSFLTGQPSLPKRATVWNGIFHKPLISLNWLLHCSHLI